MNSKTLYVWFVLCLGAVLLVACGPALPAGEESTSSSVGDEGKLRSNFEVNGYEIGPNADLSNANLRGTDLVGADLSRANLKRGSPC